MLFQSGFDDKDADILDAYLNEGSLMLPEADYDPTMLGFDMSELCLDDASALPTLQPEWLHDDDTETDFEKNWNLHWKKNEQYITMREWYRKYPGDFDPMVVMPKYMRLEDPNENCVKQDEDFLVIKNEEVVCESVDNVEDLKGPEEDVCELQQGM